MSYDLGNYDAIIFDLGGVIINIDYEATVNAFAKLGGANFQTIFSKAQQNAMSDNFEKGLISPAEFVQTLSEYLPTGTSAEAIHKAWNCMLLDIPEERIAMLKAVNAKLPSYLLSNTNAIHIDFIHHYLQASFNTTHLNHWFTKAYLSYEIHLRKPDAEIFEWVLNENALTASRVLFIDDSPQHIATAKKLGINCHHLVEGEEITSLLNWRD